MPHNDQETIQKQQEFTKVAPRIGSRWKHYKGSMYCVVGIAMNESDEEMLILYVGDNKGLRYPWTRTWNDWNAIIDDNGTRRFTQMSSI